MRSSVPLLLGCAHCTVINLKSSTDSSYLSSLRTILSLSNLDCSAFNNFIFKNIIRGKENLEICSMEGKNSRRGMTLPLLKLLGHEIATANWGENSKQTVVCFHTGFLWQPKNGRNSSATGKILLP